MVLRAVEPAAITSASHTAPSPTAQQPGPRSRSEAFTQIAQLNARRHGISAGSLLRSFDTATVAAAIAAATAPEAWVTHEPRRQDNTLRMKRVQNFTCTWKISHRMHAIESRPSHQALAN